jgi:hypothetical protein
MKGLIQLERLNVFRSEAWSNMAIHTLALSSIWRSQALHGEENGTWMETFWVGNCLELVRPDSMIEPCTSDSDQNLGLNPECTSICPYSLCSAANP